MEEPAVSGGQAFYLYCFTRPGIVASATDLGVPGVDGVHPLDLISVEEVAALHSQISLQDFSGPDAEVSLQDPNWVIPRACRHQQVIEAMMARSPVFPLRFGAIFSSKQALENMMNERQQEISQFLDTIVGKEEWSIKGFLNLNGAREWLTTQDEDLANRQRLLPEAPGARYLQNKRFQAELQKQVRQWCRNTLNQAHEEFQALGLDFLQLPLRELEDTESEMVYHAAVLLTQEGVVDFLALVGRLNHENGPKGILLESSGPWPPYHFCPSLAESVQ